MKNLFFILTVTIFCSCINSSKNFDLPSTWTSDFTITLYEGGGMLYASTKVVLTADTCVYTEMQQGKDNIKKFKLNDDEKRQILNQLKKFNVETIKTEKTKGIVYDKETTEICFKITKLKEYCVASSASQEIKESHSKDFFDAYNYILNFAKNKSK